MDGNIIIDADEAAEFQQAYLRARKLLMWVIYRRPKDYPDDFVARPFLLGNEYAHCDPRFAYVLKAASLDALRALLPADLTRLERFPGDDTVILETWL